MVKPKLIYSLVEYLCYFAIGHNNVVSYVVIV